MAIGNESHKHGAHGQSDMHPRERPGAAASKIHALHAFEIVELREIVLRLLRLRHHHLGHEQPPGAAMKHAAIRYLSSMPIAA